MSKIGLAICSTLLVISSSAVGLLVSEDSPINNLMTDASESSDKLNLVTCKIYTKPFSTNLDLKKTYDRCYEELKNIDPDAKLGGVYAISLGTEIDLITFHVVY